MTLLGMDSSCVVVQELSADTPQHVRGEVCAIRFLPASTFTIPHALVAVETGVVTAESNRHPMTP